MSTPAVTACHEHNLREPLSEDLPFGIRVRLTGKDPFQNLVGGDWSKEHWFATREERDETLERMSSRYIYFRPGDAPALEFDTIDP